MATTFCTAVFFFRVTSSSGGLFSFICTGALELATHSDNIIAGFVNSFYKSALFHSFLYDEVDVPSSDHRRAFEGCVANDGTVDYSANKQHVTFGRQFYTENN